MYTSQLIAGGSEELRTMQADRFIQKIKVSLFDIHKISPSEKTSTIGIGQIKDLIKQLALSPQNGSIKAVIIYELHQATREAQNALLKLLEEPDEFTYIVTTAKSAYSVLPTIRSRCQITTLRFQPENITSSNILPMSAKEKFEYAEKISGNKNEAIKELSSWTTYLRQELIQKSRSGFDKQTSLDHITMIRRIERARNTLTNTNVNTRFFIENLLLEL